MNAGNSQNNHSKNHRSRTNLALGCTAVLPVVASPLAAIAITSPLIVFVVVLVLIRVAILPFRLALSNV